MPDPAKSVGDIDDVLSSIRRLVAEQPGPKWREADDGPERAVRPSADDRLVLTPALRVSEPDRNSAAASAENTPEHDADAAAPIAAPEASGTDLPDTGLPGADMRDAASRADTGRAEGQGSDVEVAAAAGTMQERQDVAQAVAEDSLAETVSDGSVPLAAQAGPGEQPEQTFAEDSALDTAAGEPDIPAPDAAASTDLPVNPPSAAVPAAVAHEVPRGGAANEAGSPENTAAERDDTPTSDAADEATSPPRVVGDDGWRPEMRLFDWDASAEATQDAAAPLDDTPAEFESETGDANWPDETAERAVLDLAAVRESETADTAQVEDADADDTAAASEAPGFTPIFSRRAAPAGGISKVARPEDPSPDDKIPGPGASVAPLDGSFGRPTDARPDTASDTASDTEASDQGGESFDIEAGRTQLSDIRTPDAPAPQDDTAAQADDHDGAVADASPGDMDDAELPVDETAAIAAEPEPPGETSGEASDPAQDLPAATAPDAAPDTGPSAPDHETAPSLARLTVLVGKDDAEPAERGGADALHENTVDDADGALPVDTGILEEEVLRRIVAEAVREELQGALGERITRNVRKLVRREIRLVLAADELD